MNKKMIAIALASLMMVGTATPIASAAVETAPAQNQVKTVANNNWFFNQLSARAKIFYNAMDAMRTSGSFVKGDAGIDLIGGKFTGAKLSANDVKTYLGGNVALSTDFHAARDAFVYDHSDLFYVDFSKVTFRAGIQNGKAVAVINNGSNDTYYADGFSSEEDVQAAIDEVEASIDTIIAEAGNGDAKEKIQAVHDAIINMADYDTEGDYASGLYGALVDGNAQCEGYSTSFKTILDRMNIPTVLVSGVAENSLGQKEDHMWNYVQTDGSWYAVDVTWDDPIGGDLRDDYLMKGFNVFNANHAASTNISPEGIDFKFPALNAQDYIMADQVGLNVIAEDGKDNQGLAYTMFKFSYNGMGVKQMMNQPKPLYLAGRYCKPNGEWNAWVDMSVYAGVTQSNLVCLYAEGKMQFAVTDKPMDKVFSYGTDFSQDGTNLALSEPFTITESGNSHYVPGPFVLRATPDVTATIRPQQKTQKVTIVYDERLKKTGTIGIDVSTNVDHLNYKVSNVTWKNSSEAATILGNKTTRDICTVTFDLSVDETYNSQFATYSFQVQGLVGANSQKEPNVFHYTTSTLAQVCGVTRTANMVLNAPKFAFDGELDTDTFEYDPAEYSKFSMGIMLVASKNGEESTVYNLNANCLKMTKIITNGFDVKFGVPYPDGFDPRFDGKVTFKAYHYRPQEDGSFVPVEMKSQITEKGLLLTSKDF